MSDKLVAGKDTALLWVSKADLPNKRLPIIGPYLEALLAEPRLRTNPLVTAFLARAQTLAGSCDRETISNVTTTAPGIPNATTNADAKGTDGTAAAATTPTMATTGHKHSNNTPTHVAALRPATTQHTGQARSSANQKVCTVLVALGIPKALLDVSLPSLTATEKEEKFMDMMQLLLIDGRLMVPYLTTQDLRQLSQTRQAWRSVVGQVMKLRPRSARMPASRVGELVRRRIVDTWDKVRDGRCEALPMHTLRRQAARQDHQDAGWDPLLSALEQGKAQNLQSLNIAVRPGDVHWRPRLRCASACRLSASLSFMPSLLHLVLSGNEIGTAGALALADGLQHTPHLRFSLCLAASTIGDEGIQAIAGVLHKVPESECLVLGRHYMRYPAAKQLAPCLKFVPRLTHLAFGCYSWDGMPIVERLTYLPELKQLGMARGLTSELIGLLGQQLRLLPKLSRLMLDRTHLNGDTLRELAKMVKTVLSLKYISISASPFELSAQMCIEFRTALEAQGFREVESVPGQMDAQRKAHDLDFDRGGRMLDCYTARVLSLRCS